MGPKKEKFEALLLPKKHYALIPIIDQLYSTFFAF